MTKCKTHPRYQVKRAPRSNCQACWIMWLIAENARLSEDLTSLWRAHDDANWL